MICNYCRQTSSEPRRPACDVAEAEHDLGILHSMALDMAHECYSGRDWSETRHSRELVRAIVAAEDRLRDAVEAAAT